MLKQTLESAFKSQREKSVTISNVAVVLAMTCLSYGYTQFMGRMGLQTAYLTLFCLVISAEAIYTHYHAKEMEERERMIFRAAEILTLLILFKVFLIFHNGLDGLTAEILGWQEDFFAYFFTGEYLAGLIVFITVWCFSTILANDIETLHDYEQDSSWDELGRVQNTLHLYRQRIAANLFVLGGFVVFFAIGARLNFREYIPFMQGRFNPDVPITNVLFYFVLVMVLLSQSQFALLRTRWLWNKTPIAPRLPRNWLVYGGIFFGALALIAFFLPTNYSLGFFDTLMYTINIFMLVMRFLISLILFPLSICASLFKSSNPETSAIKPPSIPEMPPAQVDSAANPLWQFIQSLLFWGMLIAVVVFALSQYVRTNKALWTALSNIHFPPFLKATLQFLIYWFRGANKAIATVISTGLKRLRPPSETIRSLERRLRQPGGLTPREQVLQLYLSLLELGSQEGPSRQEGETPYHYSQTLIASRPDIAPDLLDITDAFVEARYSRHPIEAERVPLLKTAWNRIRDHFRTPVS